MARRAVPTARFLENRRVMFDNGIPYVTQLRFSRNYLQLNLYNGVYFISRLCSVYVLPPMQQLRCGFCFLWVDLVQNICYYCAFLQSDTWWTDQFIVYFGVCSYWIVVSTIIIYGFNNVLNFLRFCLSYDFGTRIMFVI